MSSQWPVPTVPPLRENDVHVWVAELTQTAGTLLEWRDVLSDEERERAERFRREMDRKRYLASHAILRFLLAAYTGLPPEALGFGREEFGKPLLRTHCNPGNIQFNLSHSGEVALYGLTRGRRIGVDIEQIRPELGAMELALHAFTLEECETLEAIPTEQRTGAFFKIWTRKEARLKATGHGLPGDSAALTSSKGRFERALRGLATVLEQGTTWELLDLSPVPSHAAAVAVEGSGLEFRSLTWT